MTLFIKIGVRKCDNELSYKYKAEKYCEEQVLINLNYELFHHTNI